MERHWRLLDLLNARLLWLGWGMKWTKRLMLIMNILRIKVCWELFLKKRQTCVNGDGCKSNAIHFDRPIIMNFIMHTYWTRRIKYYYSSNLDDKMLKDVYHQTYKILWSQIKQSNFYFVWVSYSIHLNTYMYLYVHRIPKFLALVINFLLLHTLIWYTSLFARPFFYWHTPWIISIQIHHLWRSEFHEDCLSLSYLAL